MNKKLTALCLCAALLAGAMTAGTIAWLTDTDAAKNVMTVGNVSIVQNEQEREVAEDGSIAIGTFEDDEILIPAVYEGTLAYDGSVVVGDDYTQKIWDETVNNEIDKIVTVTNDGTQDAYIRTIFAFEDDAEGTITPYLHTLWNVDGKHVTNDADWPSEATDGVTEWLTIEVDGNTYNVCYLTYTEALASGATSSPSLVQLFLDPSATNDWYDKIADEVIVEGEDGTTSTVTENKYDILVLSQAVQAEGFDNATEALNAAFGEITVDNRAEVESWFVNATYTN